ncbi:MAG: hypothetical protein CMM93_03110 [Rickettsiales bacterium]|nr:hypothetical protein [Rickettsiales bacterium]
MSEYLHLTENTEFANIWFENHKSIPHSAVVKSITRENKTMCSYYLEMDPRTTIRVLFSERRYSKFAATLEFDDRWKLYKSLFQLRAWEELNEFRDDEYDLILDDLKKERKPVKCFLWSRNLLLHTLETLVFDPYDVSAMNIQLSNLDLLCVDKIKKKTKKVAIVIDKPNIQFLMENFHRVENIKSKFILFESDLTLDFEERTLLQKLDCTMINPFYLYHNFDLLPKKAVWKVNSRFQKPPQELIDIYPEFQIYKNDVEKVDLTLQLKRASILLNKKKYAEVKEVLEPLYDYEPTEDEAIMLRKSMNFSKMLLFPMMSNEMVSHLITNSCFEYMNPHRALLNYFDYDKIGKYLHQYGIDPMVRQLIMQNNENLYEHNMRIYYHKSS